MAGLGALVKGKGIEVADGVYLVQSRTAMTNIFAVLFQVTAALFIPAIAVVTMKRRDGLSRRERIGLVLDKVPHGCSAAPTI